MITLALIGPHGAGKSTIGRAVAARLGWRFDREIGEQLLLTPADGLDPGADAISRPWAFDRAVIAAELTRDARSHRAPRVVETWHPGNLAYAWHRNPDVSRELEPFVRAAAKRDGAVIQPVTASSTTLAARRREPGVPALIDPFFGSVATTARDLAISWGLVVLDTVWSDEASLDETVDQVVAARFAGSGQRMWGQCTRTRLSTDRSA